MLLALNVHGSKRYCFQLTVNFNAILSIYFRLNTFFSLKYALWRDIRGQWRRTYVRTYTHTFLYVIKYATATELNYLPCILMFTSALDNTDNPLF